MTRKEMVPVIRRSGKGTMYLCKPEWDLLCWIRRELGLIKVKTTKATMLSDVARILGTMESRFDCWPEDPK